jgi:hypothetical protein
MNKQIVAMAALISFWGWLCVTGCSTAGPIKSEPKVENTSATVERVSKRMPEIDLLTVSDRAWKKVQLLSLEGNVLKFRTLPFIGAELTRIRVEEIAEIRMMKKKRGAMIGALAGMTPGVGLIVLSCFDKGLNTDTVGTNVFYSSLIAAAGALVGSLVGIIADAMRTNPYDSYDFRSLSEAEKISVLRKIMKI